MQTPTHPFSYPYRVTSPYGLRTDPISGEANSMHGGIDLVGSDPCVRAVMPGRVAVSQIVTDRSNPTWQWGNYVCVLGDDGNYAYYCHLAGRAVAAGERVCAGQRIGDMGATGRVTGPHLHLEVRDGRNRCLDTAAYLGIPNRVGYIHAEDRGDSQPAAWAREAVAWACRSGILLGDETGDLRLREPCTREMAAVMLYRALGAAGRN